MEPTHAVSVGQGERSDGLETRGICAALDVVYVIDVQVRAKVNARLLYNQGDALAENVGLERSRREGEFSLHASVGVRRVFVVKQSISHLCIRRHFHYSTRDQCAVLAARLTYPENQVWSTCFSPSLRSPPRHRRPQRTSLVHSQARRKPPRTIGTFLVQAPDKAQESDVWYRAQP